MLQTEILNIVKSACLKRLLYSGVNRRHIGD